MDTQRINILLADDDMDDCNFFRDALTELAIPSDLNVVNDGEQLMKYLEAAASVPDILFLDINMPRKNGQECLYEIKRSEKLQNIQVVMFSTTNSWDTINQLFKSGAHVYVHKPSDFSQLKQVIYNALPLAGEKKFSTSPLKYILNA